MLFNCDLVHYKNAWLFNPHSFIAKILMRQENDSWISPKCLTLSSSHTTHTHTRDRKRDALALVWSVHEKPIYEEPLWDGYTDLMPLKS